MAFAGSGAADEHDVALLFEERAGSEVTHHGLVDRGVVEGEVGEFLGERQLGGAHLVAYRACLFLGDLRLEQLTEDLLDAVPAPPRFGEDVVEAGAHAGELEHAHHVDEFRALHGGSAADRSGRSRPPALGRGRARGA